MSYRKKPVMIEAHQWDGTQYGMQTINRLFPDMETVALGTYDNVEITNWEIRTLEGAYKVSPGDFIIRGVKGEYYPCKSDIFHMTYETVGEV